MFLALAPFFPNPARVTRVESRLAEARESWTSKLLTLDDEGAKNRRKPDSWSPAEIGTHLVLTEELVTIGFEKLFANPAAAPRARGFRAKRALIPLVGIRSIHPKAPKRVVPRDALSISEILRRVESCRTRFLTNLRFAAAQSSLAAIVLDHPYFGPLTIVEWGIVIAAHEARHAEQLEEAIR